MTQSADVEDHLSILAANLKASKVTFLVDGHFRDLVLVDSQTGQHFPIHRRHRAIPISPSRSYLRMMEAGLAWIRHQLEIRKCSPPGMIHIDLTINDRDVICASADFIRREGGKWEYSAINVVSAKAQTATPKSAS